MIRESRTGVEGWIGSRSWITPEGIRVEGGGDGGRYGEIFLKGAYLLQMGYVIFAFRILKRENNEYLRSHF